MYNVDHDLQEHPLNFDQIKLQDPLEFQWLGPQ